MRRLLPIFGMLALLLPAVAQAQPAVPALPDTERRTSYTVTGTTCVCSVGFQLYQDGTDVDNWIQVWLNGTRYLSTDPTFGWALSSATGPLSSIPRPITDAVLTFNAVQTGTVQIVGAERPRRLSTFSESQGVSARALNQVINTIFAELRNSWDKINDVTGRIIATQPGNTMKPLPAPGNCIGMYLNFGPDGLTPSCIAGISPGASVTVPVRQANASTSLSAVSDYFLCLDTSTNAISVTLPGGPPSTGLTFLLKDCTGHASVHNVTLVGTIDGATNYTMVINYQSTGVTWTGSQWSLN